MSGPIRQNGFILVIVISALALIAAELFILTGGSNTILFQANNAYLEACQQNLADSALAWMEHKSLSSHLENLDETIVLDTGSLGINKASLGLTITKSLEKQTEVQIKTSCQRGRLTLNRKRNYQIERQ